MLSYAAAKARFRRTNPNLRAKCDPRIQGLYSKEKKIPMMPPKVLAEIIAGPDRGKFWFDHFDANNHNWDDVPVEEIMQEEERKTHQTKMVWVTRGAAEKIHGAHAAKQYQVVIISWAAFR